MGKVKSFREKWKKYNKTLERISGVNYKNKNNVLIELIKTNRLNLNGLGFRNEKNLF